MNIAYVLFVIFFLVEYLEFDKNVTFGIEAVVNGEYVYNIEQHNYMVGVHHFINSTHGQLICGAAIVSHDKIVLAAHCLYNKGGHFLLTFGAVYINRPELTMNITEEHFIIHPDYSKGIPHDHDLAVIEFYMQQFTATVGNIDMVPKTYKPKRGDVVTMLGYTTYDENNNIVGDDEFYLQRTRSTIAEFSICKRNFKEKDSRYNLDENYQLCIALKDGKTSNVSKGDSGSPLISEDGELLGVLSMGDIGTPEVYTSIAAHRDFIDNPRSFRGKRSGKTEAGSSRQTTSSSRSGSSSRSSSKTKATIEKRVDKIEDHKYTAGLLYMKDSNDGPYLCTATIISKTKILCAAHCVYEKYSVTLEFGTVDTDETYQTVNVKKSQIFVHRDYEEDPVYVNDIAIILLKTPLNFDSKIGEIKPYAAYELKADERVTLVGHSKGYLHYFESTISSFVGCRRSYWERNNDNPWLDEKRQFCVKMHNNEDNIGSGYAGGPVITAAGKFIGIFSYDFTGYPEVCTLLNGFSDFIADTKAFSKNISKSTSTSSSYSSSSSSTSTYKKKSSIKKLFTRS
ncbi:uncharacterized protein LOC116344938 [Contarinia nasturtii]|uniref:uncharacterized protein LOC116344938 n=1 Tax=Contarinia nasturtii TaxID=265458 RepID=UPI0012D3DF40|nr:uncharacterized protein LOC116344938 [Contarinia nasturtii]